MPTFPTATTLTAAQLTGATVVPLSKATARNEITVADLFGAGTVNRLAIYDSEGKLTNASFTVSVVARTDAANTFTSQQTFPNGDQNNPGIRLTSAGCGIYTTGANILCINAGSVPALKAEATIITLGQWGSTQTLKATDGGVGNTNRASTPLLIKSGEGTGSGTSGYISFQTTASEASGASLQTYVETLRVKPTGVVLGTSGTELLKLLSASATLDFGSIAAGTSADLTISVTGATVGDAVCVGTPAAPDANTTIFGFVSATDTVTVRVVNNQLVGSIDPASGTYRATVLRF